jgi:3-deoxy-D-manno-octulosonic-acid transferase
MRTLYEMVFTAGFLLSSPYYFWKMWRRGKWQAQFTQRFGEFTGKTKQAVTNRDVLWLHAVSVGEVNICTQLIRAIEPRLPNIKLVVSTTTSTGMGELQRKLPAHVEKIYYPIDRRRYVQRALKVLRPVAVVLVEAEIWPNFLWCLRDRRIPVFLVNARLSEKSYRGYLRFSRLFRPLFGTLAGVGVQNEDDAARVRQLGCRPEAVRVVGNLKFDAVRLDERRLLDVPALLRQLGIAPEARLLVGGSTHDGEEAILARIYGRLKPAFPGLFLVLVPRHMERGREVGQQLQKQGLRFVYRSEIGADTKIAPGELDCLLVNTTGELKFFYEHAAVIFVGKSLTASGGQNPIEPGAMAKPIVFGPHMENFAAVAAALVSAQGAVQVGDEAELERAIENLLADPGRGETLGKNALQVVRANQGSIDRTVDMIIEGLRHEDLYVAG